MRENTHHNITKEKENKQKPMSDNKNKWFEVTTTSIVSAPSQTEAVAAAQRKRAALGKVLSSDVQASRISAADARLVIEN